ncbi:MAG TPA: N-acetylglucosamine-6-phosphate deacetylase [Candidatus Binataceae bacterium]|nr:N-acetylglucosamine-6-phosphate deacetylase [Candidatus Binataceae bacterium]
MAIKLSGQPGGRLSGTIAAPDGTEFRGRISFSDRIQSIESMTEGSDDYIVPGLIDLQVNGSHGVDVMNASAQEIGTLSRHLAREGTTAFLPTAITSPLEYIAGVHDAIADALASQGDHDRASAAILGMHLEGPFISPARLGVHPQFNLDPRDEALDQILMLEKLRLITLAPELDGALEAIRRLTARGVAVSIGHSDATLEQARAGIAVGARMFTHLFNAMRPLNHRKPGVAAAAMLPSHAIAAVIPDGVHVHPEILRLVYRTRGVEGMFITTDKVALAGTDPTATGTFAEQPVRVADGAARLGDGSLAGSVISMLDGMRVMVDKVGVSVSHAALMAATNPARVLSVADRGAIQVGARADLLLLSRELKLKAVFVSGSELH